MKWTPQTIAFLFMVSVVGTIMLMIEYGVLTRSSQSDVADSRQLLAQNLNLVLGMISGFLIGKSTNKQ